MSTKKESAYGAPAAGTDFRKTWDKAEYEARAKQRDEEERERMKEADEALKKGLGLMFVCYRSLLGCHGSANSGLTLQNCHQVKSLAGSMSTCRSPPN